jgi:hypothetical protein
MFTNYKNANQSQNKTICTKSRLTDWNFIVPQLEMQLKIGLS